MTVFSKKLRERLSALSMTHADGARSIGLDPRRFGHYVTGLREPDFRTLIKIAAALSTTPDNLLGVAEESGPADEDARMRLQIAAACNSLTGQTLHVILIQTAAVAAHCVGVDGRGTPRVKKGKMRRR